jgi:hypothetical protein
MSDDDSPRAQLSTWVMGEIQGKPETKIPELTERAISIFQWRQPFVQALMEEVLPDMVYEIVRRAVARSRAASNDPWSLVLAGDKVLTVDELRSQGRSLAAKHWRNWLNYREHAGDRHILLSEMTKEDLLLAAQERQNRGDVEYRYARLWGELASRLKARQKVGQKFTDEQIEQINQKLNQHDEEQPTNGNV